LNFSGGMYKKGQYEEVFNRQCNLRISAFLNRYDAIIPKNIIELVRNIDNAAEKIQGLCFELEDKTDLKLYILIDEYDNFANDLLTEYGTEEYNKLVHEGGFFRWFFKTLKQIATGSESALERVIITGVSPITMDDMGSGFNIGTNISLRPHFNSMLGFTEQEVCEMLDYYELNKDEVLPIMKEWYDNYRFTDETDQSLFNTDAVLYFISRYQDYKHIPPYLVDNNLKTDYVKLRKLVVQDKKLNGNFETLNKIINDGGIKSEIVESFPYDLIAKPINYVSLLYFLGMITFSRTNDSAIPFLKMPNETIKRIIFEYLREVLESSHDFSINIYKFSDMLTEMAVHGDFKPLFQFIAAEINKNTAVRDFINERDSEQIAKLFYLKDLILFDRYIVYSEPEANKGFADMLLNPFTVKYKDIKYAYLLEFKYIKRSVKKKNLKTEIAKNVQEAVAQLNKYAIDDKVKRAVHLAPYGEILLKKVAIVFYGWEVVYCEELEVRSEE
jgi:hypothetical protein